MSRSYDGPRSRVMMNRVKKQEEDARRHGREARTEAKQEDDMRRHGSEARRGVRRSKKQSDDEWSETEQNIDQSTTCEASGVRDLSQRRCQGEQPCPAVRRSKKQSDDDKKQSDVNRVRRNRTAKHEDGKHGREARRGHGRHGSKSRKRYGRRSKKQSDYE